MDTKKVNLFVYDSKENFDKSKHFLGEEGSSFKKLICIENINELDNYFATDVLGEDEYVYMVIHVFATKQISGIKKYLTSGISEKYPYIGDMYISDGVEAEINHLMVDAKIPHAPVHKYHEVYSSLRDDKVKVYTKKQIIEFSTLPRFEKAGSLPNEHSPQCDYVIITALEEDEMAKILPMITREGQIENDKHLIEYGHLKSNNKKKIAYASQQSTGMVDAAILASELIIQFRPKFLIMPGVLGGKPGINIGDIIVSNKVFTIDKGKLTTQEIIDESSDKHTEVKIVKKEIESVNVSSSYVSKFTREKDNILSFIRKEDVTRKSKVDILFGPVACVRQVIDQKEFFEENILVVDRKAIGLEMESYGIARACELVNNGKTIPLIIKAVMDNTSEKTDNDKTYAAWTSAMFIRYILENDLI